MKLKNKRIQASLSLATGIILVFFIVIANVFHLEKTAMGVETNQGNRTTARQKLIAQALYRCIDEELDNTLTDTKIDDLKSGKAGFFKTGFFHNGIEINSPWLTQELLGDTRPDYHHSFQCSSGKSKSVIGKGELASDDFLSRSELGFTQADLICNGEEPGIYAPDTKDSYCDDIYNGEDENNNLEPSDDRLDYFLKLVEDKTFAKNIPASSIFKYTDLELYYIYFDAFTADCAGGTKGDKDRPNRPFQIKMLDGGKFKDYGFTAKQNTNKDTKVSIFDADNDEGTIKKQTCGQLEEKLNEGAAFEAYKKAVTTVDPANPDAPAPGIINPDDPQGNQSSPNTCYNSLGGNGWNSCSTAEALNSFGSGIYETVAQSFLNISPQLFQEGNKTAEAWAIFVRIANALFVILLVVVIFSQLTGIGLDNYGIKKVLPKLIISAILINTSYFICQFAVDISNIVGSSLKTLLDNIATSIGGTYGGLAGGTKALIALIAGAVGIPGAAIAGAVFASSLANVGWVAFGPVLLGLLSFVISILFLLFLLSVRQALVLVLVVISPLAFACYILPNTKKLFDKWFKIFKTMLILYPITSLLMGGGTLASSIILQGIEGVRQEDIDLATLFTAISGLIIRVAPVFFVPSVVKSSVAALGTVGAKFSGLGKQLGGKAASGIERSAGYKRAQELSRRQATQFRAGVDKDGKEIKNVGRLRRFISGGKAGMKDSRMQYLKDLDAKSTEDQVLKEGFIEAGQIAREKRAEKAALDDEMININSQTQNGEDQDALFGLYDEAVQSGNSTRARAIVEVAGRRGDTAKALMDHHHDKVTKGEFNNMSAETEAGIMKQIATGDNSKNYRASDAVAFEYASAYNKNQIQPDSKGRRMSFDTWAGNEKNVHNAISYHAASATEFFGQKNGAIKRIIGSNLREEDKERIKGYYNTVMSSNELRGSIDDEKLQTMKAFVEQGQSGGADDHIRATYSSDTMEDGQTYKL